MLTTQQMLKIDPELATLSEAELEQLRADMYGMAQLGFDIWWTRKSGSKSPVGSFPKPPIGGIVDVCKMENKKPE